MDMPEHVRQLITKAAEQKDAHVAMQFAQAALNAAHALQVLEMTALNREHLQAKQNAAS
jgi:hypothetical protein